jgi:outer membrane protein insertion porin family
LNSDKLSLDPGTFFTNGVCNPNLAGQYLCDELGTRVTSAVGASIAFDNTNGLRPTRGQRLVFSQDFAGLGGDVRYLRSQADATKYIDLGRGLIFSAHAEGGYIKALQKAKREGQDPVRITDRFFGPSPSLRGFDIRGIGPRVRRTAYSATGVLAEDDQRVTDALGGHAYYMGRAEIQLPLSSGLKSLGLRPSVFVDVGSVFGLRTPTLTDTIATCVGIDPATPGRVVNAANPAPCDTTLYTSVPGFREEFLGNSAKPRLAIGVGVNWNSPFGPLRIDVAKALLKQEGDDPKLFSFNVGTQF